MSGSLKNYVDSPLWLDGLEFSASNYNILRKNAEILRFAATQAQQIFNIGRGINFAQNSTWIWRGGFQYRTGLTTARIIMWVKSVSGQGDFDVSIKFDGVEVDRFNILTLTTVNVGGLVTRDIALGALGYTDYQIITVEITPERVSGTGNAWQGEQYVFDAYTFPLASVATLTWPGIPTFGTVDASRMNNLANGEDYLAERISNVPRVLQTGHAHWYGMTNHLHKNFRYFTVRITNGNDRLFTTVYYLCKETSAKIRLNIGSIDFDYGPFSYGSFNKIEIDEDLIGAGLSYDTDYLATLEEVVITPLPKNGRETIVGRVSTGEIYMDNPGRTVLLANNPLEILQSLTYAQLKAELNSVASIVSGVNTTVTTHTRIFNRAPMFSGRPVINEAQNEFFEHTFIPLVDKRIGDVLWVKGQGVRICYGPQTLDTGEEDALDTAMWKIKWEFEEEIIGGDRIDQTYVYLDSFPALYPGMPYYLMGKDILYAAEHLR